LKFRGNPKFQFLLAQQLLVRERTRPTPSGIAMLLQAVGYGRVRGRDFQRNRVRPVHGGFRLHSRTDGEFAMKQPINTFRGSGLAAMTFVCGALFHAAAYGQIPKGLDITLEEVASGLTAPNWGTAVPGCPDLANRLVVTDQNGMLWAIDVTTGDKMVLLDASANLVSLGIGGPGTFDERGFLGVALHPAFAENGLLYTYTSEPVNGVADFSTMPEGEAANHQSVLREWQVPEPCNAMSVVNPESVRVLLRVDEPQFNHNAGAVVFGPDAMLYVAFGDGGAADDQGVGHVEGGNGQNPSNILGSIIRIDPQGTDAPNGQYGIPADNPFVGIEGFLPEIYAYGFRNPFRFSFDSLTGAMYIADVGQNDIEEVSLGVAGGNFGWNRKEGTFCFDPNGDEAGFAYVCLPEDDTTGLIDPIVEYGHTEGIAVVGGFVNRGVAVPPLHGKYVFGDYTLPDILSGRLFYLAPGPEIREFDLGEGVVLGMSVLGFGQDAAGELYVMANATGTPSGETGVVLRIETAGQDADIIGKNGGDNNGAFTAHLTGGNEVQPVAGRAQGQAVVKVRNGLLDVKLSVTNLDDIVAAHIHCAAAGVNGPVGVSLFSGGPTSESGILVQATIAGPDLGNNCEWSTLGDIAEAIVAGNAYVNVHTLANPAGAIRGQLN
jgi:glucose/arabinose dehydrogenase